MRNRLLIAVFILFTITSMPANADAQPVTAFFPGERLDYVLKYAGIAAGDSVMRIENAVTKGGKPYYKVISTAESRALIDVFYKVRNKYETHIDPVEGVSLKYVFHQNEGGKKKDRVLIFDQDRHIVTRIVREDGKTQSKVYEILANTQDNLSSMYALRNEELEVGKSVVFRVFEGRKNWELIVDILAEEEIKVKAGTFKTIKVHPKLKYEGLFRRKGELFVWVTADKWHIPVLMKSKVNIGSVIAELKEYTLGGSDGNDGSVNELNPEQ